MSFVKQFDVIVVGSGIGGLFAAAKCAKEGKKVLVIEQHSIAGGYVTTFKRKDYIFEAGLHAIDGLFSENNPTARIFREMGVYDNVNFLRLPEFYKVMGDTINLTIPDTLEGACESLHRAFPEEKKAISSYIKTIGVLRSEIMRFPTKRRALLWTIPTMPFRFPHILKHFFYTSGKYLDSLTHNSDLKISLTANSAYYHDDPYEHAMLHFGGAQGSFLTGGCSYIQGGSGRLVQYLTRLIEQHKGVILLKHRVTSLLADQKKVFGVQFTNGNNQKVSQEMADAIIINAPIPNLINNLLPKNSGAGLRRKFNNFTISHSVLVLYMGLSKPLSSLGNSVYSTFVFPADVKHLKDVSHHNKTIDYQKKIMAFVDYGAVESQLCPAGRTVASCVVVDDNTQWENLSKEEYKVKKEHVAQILLSRLEQTFPGIRNLVDYYEVATPLTMKRYTENPLGAIYGYAQVAGQIGANRPNNYSGLPGLYFASAWSQPSGGINPSARSGYYAALEVLKRHQ